MSFYVVDVETAGPIPGHDMYPMLCFAAVKVTDDMDINDPNKTFYGETGPWDVEKGFSPGSWNKEAAAVSGISYEEYSKFIHPEITMKRFAGWIEKTNSSHRPTFISDNVAFDWQFINYYFHYFIGSNPFGWSGRRIGDLYCGQHGDVRCSWKHLRKTKHTHNPVDDAMGNAEALIRMRDDGLKMDLT